MQWISDRPRHNQGVQAIFAVTNFWEHLFTGSTAPESRDKEVEQGMQVFTFDNNFLIKEKSNMDYQLHSLEKTSGFSSPLSGPYILLASTIRSIMQDNAKHRPGIKIATAASKTASLTHYIWSSLPSGDKTSGGKFSVPHCDSKAIVDQPCVFPALQSGVSRKSFPAPVCLSLVAFFSFEEKNNIERKKGGWKKHKIRLK